MEWLCLAVIMGFITLIVYAAGGFEDPIVTQDRVIRMREAYLRNTDPTLNRDANWGGAAAAYYLHQHKYN